MKKFLRLSFSDKMFSTISFLSAILILLLIVGIFFTLFKESTLAIKEFGFIEFITNADWDPAKEIFGGASQLFGTIITTILALIFAIPVGIGIAIFLTEVSPSFLKTPLGIAIEMLAAIPSIIYGMWGLFTLAPIISEYVEPALNKTLGQLPVIGVLFQGVMNGIDIFTASLVLSIMIIPFIASVARDALNLTPSIMKESAYALGATKWEVVKDVMIPYSKLGIYGGIVLALGRVLGETMAVAFIIGNVPQITPHLFDPATTITTTLANEFTEADSELYLSSLFYLAFILFILSFVVLAIAKFYLLRVERGFKR